MCVFIHIVHVLALWSTIRIIDFVLFLSYCIENAKKKHRFIRYIKTIRRFELHSILNHSYKKTIFDLYLG